MLRPAGQGYRRDVDGLRAIAVLAVVGFHSGLPFLKGGFVGVDVFFVISGFLITGLLTKEANATGTIQLAAFYARRVRRLLPALVCAILGTLLLGLLFLLPWGEQQRLAWSALATAGFASNFYFWMSAGNYFAAPVEREPLLHTWSLAVEEQFYFAWPLALLTSHRLAQRLHRSPRAVLAVMLGVTFIGSLASCVVVTESSPSTAFYLVPFRAWEFAAGGLLSLVAWRPSPACASVLGLSGLGAIGFASTTFGPQTAFPGWAALLPTVGTLAVIAAGGGAGSARWLATAPMVQMGQWSYSWYLWHWPLIAIGRAVELAHPDPARDGALSLIALGLAILSYRFVETPIRLRMPGPFGGRRGTLVTGALLSVLLACSAGLYGVHARHTLRSVEPFRSMLTLMVADQNTRSDCGDATIGVDCRTPDWGQHPGLVLWGDSHARRLWPLVKGTGPVLARTQGNCPPLLGGVRTLTEGGRPDEACRVFNSRVEGDIGEAARSGEVRGVILAARWPFYLGQRTPAGYPSLRLEGSEGSLGALRNGLASAVDLVVSSGARVLIVAPMPEQAVDVPTCLFRRSAALCAVPRTLASDYRAAALAVMRQLVEGRAGVRVVDAFDVLCPGDQCPAEKGGVPLFVDSHHLTNVGLDQLDRAFREPLRWLREGEPVAGQDGPVSGLDP